MREGMVIRGVKTKESNTYKDLLLDYDYYRLS